MPPMILRPLTPLASVRLPTHTQGVAIHACTVSWSGREDRKRSLGSNFASQIQQNYEMINNQISNVVVMAHKEYVNDADHDYYFRLFFKQ